MIFVNLVRSANRNSGIFTDTGATRIVCCHRVFQLDEYNERDWMRHCKLDYSFHQARCAWH